MGRIPEITTEQILQQIGTSMRRLAHLLERLHELQEINPECDLADLVPLAGLSLPAQAR